MTDKSWNRRPYLSELTLNKIVQPLRWGMEIQSMSVTPTEQEIRAFVGSNAEYYLRAWRPALSNEGGTSRFNVAAFLITGLWLGYRKMYSAVFILFGIIIAGTVLESILFIGILKMPDSPPALNSLFGPRSGTCHWRARQRLVSISYSARDRRGAISRAHTGRSSAGRSPLAVELASSRL